MQSPNGFHKILRQLVLAWNTATYHLFQPKFGDIDLHINFQVPGTAVGQAHLTSSEIEIGMGIHNEAGVQRVSPVPPLNELIQTLLDLLLSQSDPERGFLPTGGSGKDNVVLLVNNLGGVSELELGGIVREAVIALAGRGVAVQRVVSGTFMVLYLTSFHAWCSLGRGTDELEHARLFAHPSRSSTAFPYRCATVGCYTPSA
jgi:Dak1 domain